MVRRVLNWCSWGISGLLGILALGVRTPGSSYTCWGSLYIRALGFVLFLPGYQGIQASVFGSSIWVPVIGCSGTWSSGLPLHWPAHVRPLVPAYMRQNRVGHHSLEHKQDLFVGWSLLTVVMISYLSTFVNVLISLDSSRVDTSTTKVSSSPVFPRQVAGFLSIWCCTDFSKSHGLIFLLMPFGRTQSKIVGNFGGFWVTLRLVGFSSSICLALGKLTFLSVTISSIFCSLIWVGQFFEPVVCSPFRLQRSILY